MPSQIKDISINNEKSGDSKGGDNGQTLSARELLRLKMSTKGAAQEQMAGTAAMDKGPHAARGSPAPPRVMYSQWVPTCNIPILVQYPIC